MIEATRNIRFKNGVAVFLMILSLKEGVEAYEDAECKNGTVQNHLGLECCFVECKEGYQAKWCEQGKPSSSFCEPCSDDKYMDEVSKLGDDFRCHYKRLCIYKHMVTIHNGSQREDRKCGCTEGHDYDAYKHWCLTVDHTTYYTGDDSDVELLTTPNPTLEPTTEINIIVNDKEGPPSNWFLMFLVLVPVVVIIFVYIRFRKERKGSYLPTEREEEAESSV